MKTQVEIHTDMLHWDGYKQEFSVSLSDLISITDNKFPKSVLVRSGKTGTAVGFFSGKPVMSTGNEPELMYYEYHDNVGMNMKLLIFND